MKDGSLCALGGFTPYPVMSALTAVPRGIRACAGGGGVSRFS
jgi:formate dehydrogenase iron-sulfur subunit